jgi:hypothetical protein
VRRKRIKELVKNIAGQKKKKKQLMENPKKVKMRHSVCYVTLFTMENTSIFSRNRFMIYKFNSLDTA